MLPPAFLEKPFAHRGLWDELRPENSLAAAQAAIDRGYGIEMDIQMSADGEAMVFHDDRLDRMTDQSGWVAELTAQELARIKLAGSEQTIPTLQDMLDVVGGRVPLLVELKDQTAHPGGTLGPLEERVAAVLKGYEGPVAVMSFHPGMVDNLAAFAPDIPRGPVGELWRAEDIGAQEAEERNTFENFERAKCSFLSHDWKDLAMPGVARLKAAGFPVLCWTVRSAEEEARAREVADNVTFEHYLPA